MNLTRSLLLAPVVAAPTLMAVPPAPAMLITHSTQGPLFDETFEGQTVGLTPTTAGISPDGNGETWDPLPVNGNASALTWNAASGGPVAYEGSQYLRMERIATGSANLAGNWTPAVSDGDLTLKFAVYVPSGQPSFAFDIVVDEQSGNALPSDPAKAFELTLKTDGGNYRVVRLNPTFDDYINTNIVFTPDTWHEWTIVYHQNAGGPETYDVTVDANSDFGLPALKNTSSLQRFFVRAANNGSLSYLDATPIPEPASAALLVAGAALLSRRRHR